MARDEKRRDPGEFYPGGKVWVKPGQSQPQVHVTWEQIEGKPQIAPLPDKYRDSDVKGKINEIASKFATVVVAAFISWTACADVTVQKKRKDEIFNDEMIVVDVTGSGVGVDTNAVRDIVKEQLSTNGIRSVDGAARPLPKYIHLYEADDSYPDAAAEYYRSRGNGKVDGGCSSVRDGGFLYRNFDYPFDDRAEFVVKMSAGPNRFASVGVAQVGTNLTEQIVTSGKPEYSHLYKWLPGATVDGINENGVVCEINVDGGPKDGWHGDAEDDGIHILAAVRWVLDHGETAAQAAEWIADHVIQPQGEMNFHFMVADATITYIVENGEFHHPPYSGVNVLTNYALYDGVNEGGGKERYQLLAGGADIKSVWYTNAYRRETTPPWVSDLAEVIAYTNEIFDAWATHDKEYFRGKTNNGQPWWQTVHTSVYDLTNRVLRVAVQEVDDWYVFQVPSSGAKIDAYTKAETDAKLADKVEMSDVETYHEEHVPTLDDVCNSGYDAESREVIFSYVTANAFRTPYGDFEGDYINTEDGQFYLPGNPNYGSNDNDMMTRGQTPILSPYNQGYAANADLADYATSLNNSGRKLDTSMTPEGDTRWADINGGSEEPFAYLSELPNISATDTTFSKAVMGVASHTNAAFAAEVLAVQVSGLSTNITEEVYIAATNACANLGIDPSLIPQGGMLGTVGGLIVMLFAVVFWMKRKIFDNSGKVTDEFAGELLGKSVAINALHYALYSVPTTGADANKLKDMAVNAFTFTGSLPTFPAQVTGYARDFLLNVTATADGSNITIPEPDGSTATSIGDALAFTAGKTYLVAITEIAAKHYYIRVIDTTPANAA